MIIRQAKQSDAEQLKKLYFEYLTAFPPTEEQNMETGSNKESTLNFYRNNGFATGLKHSCLKKSP